MNYYTFIVTSVEYNRLRGLTTLSKLDNGTYYVRGRTLIETTTREGIATALVCAGDIVEFVTH